MLFQSLTRIRSLEAALTMEVYTVWLYLRKNDRIEEILKTNIPNYTQVVVLVNSPFYGGSGGKWATSTVNFKSNDIAVHEIGHSFAQLADEYWAGNQYAIESANRSQSADADHVPWKYWLGKDGVGIYSYGGKGSTFQLV